MDDRLKTFLDAKAQRGCVSRRRFIQGAAGRFVGPELVLGVSEPACRGARRRTEFLGKAGTANMAATSPRRSWRPTRSR